MSELRERIAMLYTTPLPDGRMMSMKDIATELGVHHATVAWHLKKAGVPRRPKGTRALFPSQYDEVVRQYTTLLPDGTWKGSKAIAADFGVSDGTIQNALRKMGVTLRDAKEAHAHGKRCGPIKYIDRLNEAPLCACGCGHRTYWSPRMKKWMPCVRGHHPPAALYKSVAWLREQYVDNRRSAPEMAAKCGVNTTTIVYALRQAGIARRHIRDALKGRQRGAKNPAWKGGTTPERQRLYKEGGWREFALNIYKRDGFTCRRCATAVNSYRGVAAHHIRPWADAPELRYAPDNIVTLCTACHRWVHSKANVNRDFLA